MLFIDKNRQLERGDDDARRGALLSKYPEDGVRTSRTRAGITSAAAKQRTRRVRLETYRL